MRVALVSHLIDIGRHGWVVCSCGHRAPADFFKIGWRHRDKTIGAFRAALRCEGCRFKSKPWLIVSERMTSETAPAVDRSRQNNHAKGLSMFALGLKINAAATLDKLKAEDPLAYAELMFWSEFDAEG